MEGKITRVVSDKGFFFIDDDYWCHNNNYEKIPEIGDVVRYDQITQKGKNNARNVKFLRAAPNPSDNYFKELSRGYFSSNNYLREDFIIHFPDTLAKLFSARGNKINQVRNYYEQISMIAGNYKIKKDFDWVKVELMKLIPLANKSFDKKNISIEFKDFLIKNVQESVKSEDNFIKGFYPHFECLINYFQS